MAADSKSVLFGGPRERGSATATKYNGGSCALGIVHRRAPADASYAAREAGYAGAFVRSVRTDDATSYFAPEAALRA